MVDVAFVYAIFNSQKASKLINLTQYMHRFYISTVQFSYILLSTTKSRLISFERIYSAASPRCYLFFLETKSMREDESKHNAVLGRKVPYNIFRTHY